MADDFSPMTAIHTSEAELLKAQAFDAAAAPLLLVEGGFVAKRGWLFPRRETLEWAQGVSIGVDEVVVTAVTVPAPEIELVGDELRLPWTMQREVDEATVENEQREWGEDVELRPVVRAVGRLWPLDDGAEEATDAATDPDEGADGGPREQGAGGDGLARHREEEQAPDGTPF